MDPRRQRTQRRLQDALFLLLTEHDFDDIRVTDIVKEADVALPTFYRNYENKVDLLENTIKSISGRIETVDAYVDLTIENMLKPDQPVPTLPFVQFIDENLVVFQRLLHSRYSTQVVEAFIAFMSHKIQGDTPEWEPHEVDLMVGSIVGCMYQWILGERKYTVEEISYMMHWMTLSGVLALRGKLNTENIMINFNSGD